MRYGRSIPLVALLLLAQPACRSSDPAVEAEPPAVPAAAPAAPSAADVESRLGALRDAVAAAPEDNAARRELAIALHAAGRSEEAIAEFERLATGTADARALLDLAIAYNSVSRIAEAEATYGRLLALDPRHAIALHNLGNIASKRGDNEGAIARYREALDVRPDYLLARFHLAQALQRTDRFEEAYRAFESVIELDPSNPQEVEAFDDALYGMASLDITMGAYERAGSMLAELIRANPEHRAAYYAYGQVLVRLGRSEEAQRAFETHQKLMERQSPTGPMAHGE